MFRSRISRTTASHALYGVPAIGLSLAVVGALTIGLTGAASAAATPTVKLTVNGNTSSVTTNAGTVGALLQQEDVHYDNNDLLSPSTGARIVDGMNVNMRRAVAVTVVDDGAEQHHVVPAVTVGQAVQKLGLPSGARLAKTSYQSRQLQADPRLRPTRQTHQGQRSDSRRQSRDSSRCSHRLPRQHVPRQEQEGASAEQASSSGRRPRLQARP